MQKKNNNVLSSEFVKDITEEFASLRAALHGAQQTKSPDTTVVGKDDSQPLLAVTRIISGVDLDSWNEIAAAQGLKGWLAFSMHHSACRNIRALQQELEELMHQTAHDPLTGLANRRAFETKLQTEVERVDRSNGQLSLVVLDIDHFKKVNDTYGHPCGDKVLTTLAEVLDGSKRAYDVAARIGGEEFALILPGASPIKAKAVVERLLSKFASKSFTCEEHPLFTCTFSAGVASLRGRTSSTPEDLLALADKALYEAKNNGRNCVHVARQRVEVEYDRSTMVHSNEKQFLFSGPE